jgi:hypothetical protein
MTHKLTDVRSSPILCQLHPSLEHDDFILLQHSTQIMYKSVKCHNSMTCIHDTATANKGKWRKDEWGSTGEGVSFFL